MLNTLFPSPFSPPVRPPTGQEENGLPSREDVLTLWKAVNGVLTEYIGLSTADYAAVGSEWQGVFFTDPSTLREFADFAALWSAVTAVKSFNAAHVMGVAGQEVIVYPEGTDGSILNRAYRYLKMVYDTEMVLMHKIWSVVGRQTRIGVNNLLRNFLADPTIALGGGVGALSKTAWTDTPTDTSDDGATISFVQSRQTVSAEYNVAPVSTPGGLTVLVIGDSTVTLGLFATKIAALAVTNGTPALRFIGTQGDLPERNEGYPGRTLNWLYFDAASPFYAGFDDYSDDYGVPDAVIFQCSTNELFAFTSDSLANAHIGQLLISLDGFVDDILAVNPNAYIGVDISNGGPKSDAQIKTDYAGTIPGINAWRTRRNFDLFSRTLIAHELPANVDVLHAGLSITIPNNFLNSLHPNSDGYQQKADVYYAWLKNKINPSVNNLLGWHNSIYSDATRSTSQSNGTQTADILRITYYNQFSGVGIRRYYTEKRQYTFRVRFFPINTDITNVFIGITLWNGTTGIAYDLPADKGGLLVSFLGYQNYANRVKTPDAHFTVGAWNTFETTINLIDAPDFDSVSFHVSVLKPAPTGVFDMIDIDLLNTKLIPIGDSFIVDGSDFITDGSDFITDGV